MVFMKILLYFIHNYVDNDVKNNDYGNKEDNDNCDDLIMIFRND